VPAGKAFNEMARLGHEDDPIVLDQNEQASAWPDAKLLASLLRDDNLVLAAQRERGRDGCTVK